MPEGKYARKKRLKLATSREAIEKTKALDGRTREIADQLPRDGSRRMKASLLLEDATKPVENSAAAPTGWVEERSAAVAQNAASGALSDAKNYADQKDSNLADKNHGHNDLADKNHGHNDLADKNHGHSYSEIKSTPNFPNATNGALNGAYRHTHSISFTPFIKLSRKERGRLLADRLENRMVMDSPLVSDAVRIVARNIENQMVLMMDYRDYDAFERERRFGDPAWAEWTEAYKQIYGVDEYAEEDRNWYLSYGEYRMDPYKGIALTSEPVGESVGKSVGESVEVPA